MISGYRSADGIASALRINQTTGFDNASKVAHAMRVVLIAGVFLIIVGAAGMGSSFQSSSDLRILGIAASFLSNLLVGAMGLLFAMVGFAFGGVARNLVAAAESSKSPVA